MSRIERHVTRRILEDLQAADRWYLVGKLDEWAFYFVVLMVISYQLGISGTWSLCLAILCGVAKLTYWWLGIDAKARRLDCHLRVMRWGLVFQGSLAPQTAKRMTGEEDKAEEAVTA